MKRTNILYWSFTGIFALFMIFSALGNIMVNVESIALLSDVLGYPKYIIPFLGVAKVLGAIAILIPGFPRVKEWAYAGLFFDLLGATYSIITVTGFEPSTLGMVPIFGFLFLSYFFYHKRKQQLEGANGRVVMA